jgi:hypothetical protein
VERINPGLPSNCAQGEGAFAKHCAVLYWGGLPASGLPGRLTTVHCLTHYAAQSKADLDLVAVSVGYLTSNSKARAGAENGC